MRCYMKIIEINNICNGKIVKCFLYFSNIDLFVWIQILNDLFQMVQYCRSWFGGVWDILCDQINCCENCIIVFCVLILCFKVFESDNLFVYCN